MTSGWRAIRVRREEPFGEPMFARVLKVRWRRNFVPEEELERDGRIRAALTLVVRVKVSGAKFLVAPPPKFRVKPREGGSFVERLRAAGLVRPRPAAGLLWARPAAGLPRPRPPPPERPFRANAGWRRTLKTSASAGTKIRYFFAAILALDFWGYCAL